MRTPVDPVQLIADHVAGIAPLEVSFKVQAKVPGEIKRVLYDFDGDHVRANTLKASRTNFITRFRDRRFEFLNLGLPHAW